MTGAVAMQTRDAATVMLLRDAENGAGEGLEVFMLRRNLQSEFVGGAYVFPGGAVDPHDCHVDLEAVCAGRTDASASRQLGIENGGLAFWVAAIRECFEESGILLAYDDHGDVVRLTDDPSIEDRFREHRLAVDRGDRRMVDVCEQEGVQLAVDSLHYFSHWITPEGAPRRYDTRFFMALAPEGQVPLHDNREVIENLWIRPRDALERHDRGDFDLIFPTRRSLVALEQFSTANEALRHAESVGGASAIQPRIVSDEGGGFRIVLPDDPEYLLVQPAELPKGVPMNKLEMRDRGRAGDLTDRSARGREGGR